MTQPHLVIVGGGLAGLSAGCHARASGFRTTIVEHAPALGGVCTAWSRGPYTVDGCIHWLTGGPFDRLYEELGIIPQVERRTLDEWITYSSVRAGVSIRFGRDLDALRRDLCALAPQDAVELGRLIDGARGLADLVPPIDHPRELDHLREQLAGLWQMRHHARTLVHFRMPLAAWIARLRSPALRRLFATILPVETPAVFLCMVLGYLERGQLSRPVGGTARFRDALIASYTRAGGEVRTNATVEEVVVKDGRATGVRLTDGRLISGTAVVSTSSMPETALQLLGGRYDADSVRHRMEAWRMFDPIVLASFGVAMPLADLPPLWILDEIEPFRIGGTRNDHLYVRISNDDPTFAPRGHVVVQAMLATGYDWWATRGASYDAAKDAAAEVALANLDRYVLGLRPAVRMHDISTPLTFWNRARSWRGAFEGWIPNRDGMFGHVSKTLGNLKAFYMAGQWVEPGGGVPTAIMSGRHAVQLLCSELEHPFHASAVSQAA